MGRTWYALRTGTTHCFLFFTIVFLFFTIVCRFRRVIGKFKDVFATYQQQDAQEFLSCLVDGLGEDLNRIDEKPCVGVWVGEWMDV